MPKKCWLTFVAPSFVACFFLFALSANAGNALLGDADNDGISDDYEQFAGLDPANPSDSLLDPDKDSLLNVVEAQKGTDPFVNDTDRDGFPDSQDAAPVSRAFLQFGSTNFTAESFYEYFHPLWLGMVFKHGGEWGFDESCGLTAWHVDATEKPGVGSLNVVVDRALLTNNLVYALHFFDSTNSSMFLDLLDMKGAMVVKDLYGNLLTGAQEHMTNWFAIPLAMFSNAATIRLRRGEGNITIYEGSCYVDEDGDGLDKEQEEQLGSSDVNNDTNGNGINDFDELFLHQVNPAATTNVAPGSTNAPVPVRPPRKPKPARKSNVIYIDRHIGHDAFTGGSPVVEPIPVKALIRGASLTTYEGPKKTIANGMSAAESQGADTLIIKTGTYNENLNIHGKAINVRIQGNVCL